MKKLLLIVLPLLLIVRCSKEPINYESLTNRNGVKYEKDSQSPFTGEVFELHNNGNKSIEGNYKNGLMNGIWTYWDENGQKKLERPYKNGK